MNISMNPNSELEQSIVSVPDIVQVPDILISQARQFQQVMMMYTCAIREVKTKLEVLNDELSVRNQRNPIEMIKSRVKKPMSIVEKLQRKGLPISLEAMVDNLDDVAGIRVICSFVDDIYDVADKMCIRDSVPPLPGLTSGRREFFPLCWKKQKPLILRTSFLFLCLTPASASLL